MADVGTHRLRPTNLPLPLMAPMTGWTGPVYPASWGPVGRAIGGLAVVQPAPVAPTEPTAPPVRTQGRLYPRW